MKYILLSTLLLCGCASEQRLHLERTKGWADGWNSGYKTGIDHSSVNELEIERELRKCKAESAQCFSAKGWKAEFGLCAQAVADNLYDRSDDARERVARDCGF